ncbi:hypothetical protein [Streptomyces sp. NBRC 109706]|uniref:hypothetical protein n=1 Tax=Streptomyces sp. NBRC 109706 TaxID=1550035 RepID=UPI0007837FAA|nr:hypothetical protein [Streptomyces sp. NBRC 109706]
MLFFTGAWGESFDRLWGAFLIEEIHFPDVWGLTPATWISVITAGVALLSLVSTEIAKRRIDRLGHSAVAGTLLGVTALIAVGVLLMASARGFAMAIGAYLLVQVLRPVAYPLVTGWIVSRVDSRVRATSLAARDMFDSGGQIIGGPAVGWIGLVGTIRTALFAGALVLLPAIALLIAATRRAPAAHPDAHPAAHPNALPAALPDEPAEENAATGDEAPPAEEAPPVGPNHREGSR